MEPVSGGIQLFAFSACYVLGKSCGTCLAASPTLLGKTGLVVQFIQTIRGQFSPPKRAEPVYFCCGKWPLAMVCHLRTSLVPVMWPWWRLAGLQWRMAPPSMAPPSMASGRSLHRRHQQLQPDTRQQRLRANSLCLVCLWCPKHSWILRRFFGRSWW